MAALVAASAWRFSICSKTDCGRNSFCPLLVASTSSGMISATSPAERTRPQRGRCVASCLMMAPLSSVTPASNAPVTSVSVKVPASRSAVDSTGAGRLDTLQLVKDSRSVLRTSLRPLAAASTSGSSSNRSSCTPWMSDWSRITMCRSPNLRTPAPAGPSSVTIRAACTTTASLVSMSFLASLPVQLKMTTRDTSSSGAIRPRRSRPPRRPALLRPQRLACPPRCPLPRRPGNHWPR